MVDRNHGARPGQKPGLWLVRCREEELEPCGLVDSDEYWDDDGRWEDVFLPLEAATGPPWEDSLALSLTTDLLDPDVDADHDTYDAVHRLDEECQAAVRTLLDAGDPEEGSSFSHIYGGRGSPVELSARWYLDGVNGARDRLLAAAPNGWVEETNDEQPCLIWRRPTQSPAVFLADGVRSAQMTIHVYTSPG